MKDEEYRKMFEVDMLKNFLDTYKKNKTKALYYFFRLCRDDVPFTEQYSKKLDKNSSYECWRGFYEYILYKDEKVFFKEYIDGLYYKLFLELLKKINEQKIVLNGKAMQEEDFKNMFRIDILEKFLNAFKTGDKKKSLNYFFEICSDERENVNPYSKSLYKETPDENSSYEHWVGFYNFSLRVVHWDDYGFMMNFDDGWYYKIFSKLNKKINTK